MFYEPNTRISYSEDKRMVYQVFFLLRMFKHYHNILYLKRDMLYGMLFSF